MVKLQASTINFIGNEKYNWVFFQQSFKVLPEMSVIKSLKGSYFSCKLRQNLFLVMFQVFLIQIVPLVLEGYDINWKEIWSYNTGCYCGQKNEKSGL